MPASRSNDVLSLSAGPPAHSPRHQCRCCDSTAGAHGCSRAGLCPFGVVAPGAAARASSGLEHSHRHEAQASLPVHNRRVARCLQSLTPSNLQDPLAGEISWCLSFSRAQRIDSVVKPELSGESSGQSSIFSWQHKTPFWGEQAAVSVHFDTSCVGNHGTKPNPLNAFV